MDSRTLLITGASGSRSSNWLVLDRIQNYRKASARHRLLPRDSVVDREQDLIAAIHDDHSLSRH
jgi:hypothetical protein